MLQLCVYQDIEYLGSLESTQEARLAHKSSFWARSATVSAKRDRTSAERERERERASAKRERAKAGVLPHQTRKPSERLWESLTRG